MTEGVYVGQDANVTVDGEEAVLHITDQSVMLERGGKVSGFLRSAIQLVKPDGEAMMIHTGRRQAYQTTCSLRQRI